MTCHQENLENRSILSPILHRRFLQITLATNIQYLPSPIARVDGASVVTVRIETRTLGACSSHRITQSRCPTIVTSTHEGKDAFRRKRQV